MPTLLTPKYFIVPTMAVYSTYLIQTVMTQWKFYEGDKLATKPFSEVTCLYIKFDITFIKSVFPCVYRKEMAKYFSFS